jgi:hypothetical protein
MLHPEPLLNKVAEAMPPSRNALSCSAPSSKSRTCNWPDGFCFVIVKRPGSEGNWRTVVGSFLVLDLMLPDISPMEYSQVNGVPGGPLMTRVNPVFFEENKAQEQRSSNPRKTKLRVKIVFAIDITFRAMSETIHMAG